MDKALLTLAALRGDLGSSLELVFQPIKSVTAQVDDPPSWYEALLRLRTSNGDLLCPGEFMPPDTAGNVGLLTLIDQWVLRQAGELLHSTDHTYSVNFSRYLLADESLVDHIKMLVNGYGDRLILEIPERYKWSEMELAALRLLKPVVRLSLDDVGVGRLEYIAKLPITEFKIDGSLIQHVLENGYYQDLVRMLMRLACRLDMNCVCEYVSSPEIWQWLKGEACQQPGIKLFVQGFAVGDFRELQATKNRH